MLNLLTKTKPWMLASLIAATSIFGTGNSQQCPPPCPPKPCPKPCPQPTPPTQVCPGDPCCPAWPTPVLNAAYNYPARIQTRCPWDFFFDASFIYWQPMQENMELCFVDDVVSPLTFDGSIVNLGFSFKPGFKVGVGMNFDYDSWDSGLMYTWFHNTQSQSASVNLVEQQLFAMVGSPIVTDLSVYNSASENWHLKMDLLDWDLGRCYYVGTKLLFRPAFGARAAWIRQNRHATYANSSTRGSVDVSQKTTSWGLGPRVGLNAQYMVGLGFRFYGNSAADILYTRYTTLKETSNAVLASGAFEDRINASQGHIGYLRTHCELELGLGWGTYLDCNNWYMDFSAGYTFQTFFNQNMFRRYTDILTTRSSSLAPDGDLFIQGLTATFSLDF